MKTSALIVAAAALASAQAPPAGTNSVNCAKANAAYCLGGDIILYCDANMVGTTGRCSDNLSGYPPIGGVALCSQSSTTAGDAVCEKNCVVYAASSSYTLPASECSTGAATAPPTAIPTHTGAPVSHGLPAPSANFTKTFSSGDHHPTSAPFGTGSHPAVPIGTGSHSVIPVSVGTIGHSASHIANSTAGSTSTGSIVTKTNTPVAPTTTASSTTSHVPTAAAATNRAAGALAVFGIVLAYFI